MITVTSKPGHELGFGISLGDTCVLPRRRPAYRRRESDPGSCMERGNLSPRYCLRPVGRRREGVPRVVITARGRVPLRGTGADRLVVAKKPGNAGGAKGTDHRVLLADQPVLPGGVR